MAPKKKSKTKKAASPRKAAKRGTSNLIKTIITDKQITAVKKSVASLGKEVKALEKELHDGGTINMPAIHRMVQSAVEMEKSIKEQVEKSK